MSQWNLNDVGHFSHVVEISEDIFSFIHCLDNEETECVNVIVWYPSTKYIFYKRVYNGWYPSTKYICYNEVYNVPWIFIVRWYWYSLV